MESLREVTMSMTEEEIGWAHAVKTAFREHVEQNDQLQDVSDYEYAHCAILTRGNVADAVDRLEKVQEFRKEYKINDSVEEGMALLHALTQEQQPWFLVSVDYQPDRGHFTLVYDYARLNPSAVDFPEDWRIWLGGGGYYLSQLCHCNLMACREGQVHICECEGMTAKNFHMDFWFRSWHHFAAFYPHKYKECSWLHTSTIAIMQHAFFKSFMGPLAEIIRVGCNFAGYDGRIDAMFKAPSEAVAAERLLRTCLSFLRVRYHHEATFRLPEPIIATNDDPPDNNDEGEIEEGDFDG